MNAPAIAAHLDAIGAELRAALQPQQSAAYVYAAIERLPFADVIEALRLRALHNSDQCAIADMDESAGAWYDVAAALDEAGAVEKRAARLEGDRL